MTNDKQSPSPNGPAQEGGEIKIEITQEDAKAMLRTLDLRPAQEVSKCLTCGLRYYEVLHMRSPAADPTTDELVREADKQEWFARTNDPAMADLLKRLRDRVVELEAERMLISAEDAQKIASLRAQLAERDKALQGLMDDIATYFATDHRLDAAMARGTAALAAHPPNAEGKG